MMQTSCGSIMWGVALIFFFYAQEQVMSQETRVECREFHDLPPYSNTTPSILADLRLKQVTVEGQVLVNISWAMNIDVSIEHLTGTLIKTGKTSYLCTYNPHLVNVTASKQQWFHHLIKARPGFVIIQVTNVPLPPLGSSQTYKFKTITISRPPQRVTAQTTQAPTKFTPVVTTTLPLRLERFTGIISGGLIGLMILTSCYIIYKSCGANIAKLFGFKRLPQSPMVPVPVLIVYPAETSAFQQAVVAMAEFLQWHGGCRVAIDMWQQGKIAELGPMRWLAEQVKAAERVLIVCPQVNLFIKKLMADSYEVMQLYAETLISKNKLPWSTICRPSHSSPSCSVSEPCISAASQDLYPLILNMVAGNAKSVSDLAKFWVVQLAVQQDKRPSNLALQLRACKTFCLMKDLKKLCRNLHTNRKDEKKISELILRPGISYSEKSTVKLAEAVKKHCQRGEITENSGHL